MFFKKGLMGLSLIHKLIMKNTRTSEEMLTNANKYAQVEKMTLYTRDSKKGKEINPTQHLEG
jgi:hypothetical protein